MNDLELIVSIYRAMATKARTIPLEAWNQKRLVLYTPIQNHNNDYYFTCIVIKDENLITTIPQLVAGSYEEISSIIAQYRGDPNTNVTEMDVTSLETLFGNEYRNLHPNENTDLILSKGPLNIVATAIDQAMVDYQAAMNEFVRQHSGMGVYQLAMIFPSWSYRTNTMYKPFGFNLFTSTSGIDIMHIGIEQDVTGKLLYSNLMQLSGEVVRCVKHDNIV